MAHSVEVDDQEGGGLVEVRGFRVRRMRPSSFQYLAARGAKNIDVRTGERAHKHAAELPVLIDPYIEPASTQVFCRSRRPTRNAGRCELLLELV